MCLQSCGFGFFVINAVIEHVVARGDNLMLLVGEEERAVTLDLGAVGYLRKDGAQHGEVVEELRCSASSSFRPQFLLNWLGTKKNGGSFSRPFSLATIAVMSMKPVVPLMLVFSNWMGVMMASASNTSGSKP